MESASSPARELDAGVRARFHVLILYDTVECGQKAMSLYESLVAKLGALFEFDLKLWNLQVLCVPRIGAMAAQQAADADLIIAAIRHTNSGAGLKKFLASVLADRRAGRPAAWALLVWDPLPAAGLSAREIELMELARSHEVTVFAEHFPFEPLEDGGWNSLENLDDRAMRRGGVLEEILSQDSFLHLGINE